MSLSIKVTEALKSPKMVSLSPKPLSFPTKVSTLVQVQLKVSPAKLTTKPVMEQLPQPFQQELSLRKDLKKLNQASTQLILKKVSTKPFLTFVNNLKSNQQKLLEKNPFQTLLPSQPTETDKLVIFQPIFMKKSVFTELLLFNKVRLFITKLNSLMV